MFNTFFIFTTIFLIYNIVLILFFFKSPVLVVIVAECMVINMYIFLTHMASVTNDPRLFTIAIFLFFIASVELIFFLLFFSKNA